MLADLHTHTFLSDGQLSPNELTTLMKQAEVQFFSITDHDCFDAYTLLEIPEGLTLIPGIEFSVRYDLKEIHILGYFPPYFCNQPDPAIMDLLQKTQLQRRKRSIEFLNTLGELGVTLTLKDIQKHQRGPILSRHHLAKALVYAGYTNSMESSYKKYLDYQKPFLKLTENTPEQVISLIHQAKGLAFWAHPNLDQIPQTLPTLLEFGLDGLEMVRTAGAKIRACCKDHQILTSWGTDFHSYGQNRSLGMRVDELIFAQFRERLGI
ncbi:MAG: PHP domain-containing protein [Planctomycetota bacterium]